MKKAKISDIMLLKKQLKGIKLTEMYVIYIYNYIITPSTHDITTLNMISYLPVNSKFLFVFDTTKFLAIRSFFLFKMSFLLLFF